MPQTSWSFSRQSDSWIVKIPLPISWPQAALQAHAQISGQLAHFLVTYHVVIRAFDHRFGPISDELRGNEPKCVLVTKNTSTIYNLSMFGVQKFTFSRQTVKIVN